MPKTTKTKKPTCKLSGRDGNAFAVIGAVSKTLRNAGEREKAKAFVDAAMNCPSYDSLLQLVFDYVDVE